MKQFNPFPDVPTKYGSPMGRRGDMARYNATAANICYFVQEADGNETEMYSRIINL